MLLKPCRTGRLEILLPGRNVDARRRPRTSLAMRTCKCTAAPHAQICITFSFCACLLYTSPSPRDRILS
eukprot:6360063-Pyramimonas_sp.AAC.1